MIDFDHWGVVPGDGNADAIISDRTRVRRTAQWGAALTHLILYGAAIWFALTGHHGALALEIVAAVWAVAGSVAADQFAVNTMTIVAERRIQLVEQKLAEMAISDRQRGRHGDAG